MPGSRALYCLLLVGLLTGCGNLQLVKQAKMPQDVSGKPVELSDARPLKDEVMPRAYEVPNKSLFIQQTSGGSLAVGLLFGPLGVLANMANIDRLTKEMGDSAAASNLMLIDARQVAQAAIGDRFAGLPASGDPRKIKLKPFIVYFVSDEKNGIDILPQLRAELEIERDGKPVKWTGNYAYYLGRTLPFDTFKTSLPQDQLDALNNDLRQSFVEMFNELQLDLKPGNPPKRDIAWVKSRVLGIGMPGDIEKNKAGHLVVRGIWGATDNFNAVIFDKDSQYIFDNGPVARETKSQ